MINSLKVKIEKWNKYIKERNLMEGDFVCDFEVLWWERDEKLLEYWLIMKMMN